MTFHHGLPDIDEFDGREPTLLNLRSHAGIEREHCQPVHKRLASSQHQRRFPHTEPVSKEQICTHHESECSLHDLVQERRLFIPSPPPPPLPSLSPARQGERGGARACVEFARACTRDIYSRVSSSLTSKLCSPLALPLSKATRIRLSGVLRIPEWFPERTAHLHTSLLSKYPSPQREEGNLISSLLV